MITVYGLCQAWSQVVIKAVNEILDKNEYLQVEYYAINDRDVCISQREQ